MGAALSAVTVNTPTQHTEETKLKQVQQKQRGKHTSGRENAKRHHRKVPCYIQGEGGGDNEKTHRKLSARRKWGDSFKYERKINLEFYSQHKCRL